MAAHSLGPPDEQVTFSGAGVPDQAQRLPGADLSLAASVWMVAGVMLGLASKSQSAKYLSLGKRAAQTQTTTDDYGGRIASVLFQNEATDRESSGW